MYIPVPYHIAAAFVYACILAICILALVFGLRARANVKREKVTTLARGFSPLDIQRIFIGKTYPRRLTRALIVHWAQMGYISVKQISRCRVTLTCLKVMPLHGAKKALFFDRGTYVRERDLFTEIFKCKGAEVTVNVYSPLFKRKQVNAISQSYATREDVGVYSAKHYKLKVLTFILSLAPFFFCGIYLCVTGSFQAIIFPFMMLLGLFVFRFVREIPFWFRFIWSMGWVVPSIAAMIIMFNGIFDPLMIGYASVAILVIGSYILIRFVDYRERINLSDYSDLINFRKFLLFSGKAELRNVDYYEVLPYLYAFNIKLLVKRKFVISGLPEWYESKDGKRGSLL